MTSNQTQGLNLNKLVKQVLTYAPGSILPTVIGLAASAIFTRVFGAADYGRFSLVLSVSSLLTAICSQWMQQAINRFLPSQHNPVEQDYLRKVIVGGMVLIALIQLVFFLAFAPVGILIFPQEWRPFYLPGVLLVLGTTLFTTTSSVLQAGMQAKKYTFYNLANAFIKLSLSLLLVYFIVRRAQSLVWAAALSFFLLLPFLWRMAGLKSPLVVLDRGERKGIWGGVKDFAAYGLPMVGWFLAANLLSVGDRYVIQYFRGSAELGIYAANYSLITGAVALIAAPVLLAAHPFLMRAWGEGDKEQTSRWLGVIAEWFASSGMLLVGFTWLFSQDFALWFLGPEFRAGHVVMPPVMAGIIAWQLGMYAHKPLEFANKTRYMMILSLIAAAINILLNIILIPKFGYIVAAYTTLVSYLFYNVLASIIGQRYLRWRMNWGRLLKDLIITVAGIAVIWFARVRVEDLTGYLGGLFFTITACLVLSALTFRGLFKVFKKTGTANRG